MHARFLLPALLTSLLAACTTDTPRPTPTPTPTPSREAVAPQSVRLTFRVFDSGDGDQFNATLNGRVYYFPLSWSDAQLDAYFCYPSAHENWEDYPRAPDEEYDIDNEVASYGYDAEPGAFRLSLDGSQRVAIVFTFVDADPRARQSYRQRLFIWDGQGLNQVIKTDQFRAGL